MKKTSSSEIQRGQAISFRIPSDTPDHLIKQLSKLKESERRNFSSKIAEFVMQGVGQSITKERETITIPLPHKLNKAQRNWLKHEHSEALLGSIVYQLLSNPTRATALFTSLNSNALDIDEALYLQGNSSLEEEPIEWPHLDNDEQSSFQETSATKDLDDDIDQFELESETDPPLIEAEEESDEGEEVEEDLDSLLGDFLAKMNN
ncbi:hypothetical protein PU629_00510 [Pullulanibacillus sp. KACC 23026]|uniref:hypothetical protein n=1 Tax=Pullulanibacillus sp. KACC 23026 TaxID=3028315 RepID=UPI0023B0E52F|nr:hypothetical protein [Pullulanibacillus sp. KACC 23026]WEG12870.1 hypothetical protein PU629_00510 [Pullulanibacillus sp. KACC 23026]